MARSQASEHPPIDLGVAVFGSADPEPGSEVYELSRAVGREIARLGASTITGGYGGVMEGASRGAREEGGEVIGVTCTLFRGRQPNRFLTLEIEETDLFDRTRKLFALSRGFVVLCGGPGTLSELSFLWAQARAGCLEGRIVLLDGFWGSLASQLDEEGRYDRRCRTATRVAASPGEAARLAMGLEE